MRIKNWENVEHICQNWGERGKRGEKGKFGIFHLAPVHDM